MERRLPPAQWRNAERDTEQENVDDECVEGDEITKEEEDRFSLKAPLFPPTNTEEVLRASYVIDNCELSKKTVARLMDEQELVSVDCRGTLQNVALLQIATNDGLCFIFDLHICPELMKDGGLQDLLQDLAVIKVMYDCAFYSSVLYNQFQVMLFNVFDLTCAHKVIKSQGRAIHPCLVPPVSLNVLSCTYGRGLLNVAPHVIRRETMVEPNYWEKRPLTRKLCNYAARGALCLLPEVYATMNDRIEPLMRTFFNIMTKIKLTYPLSKQDRLELKIRQHLHEAEKLKAILETNIEDEGGCDDFVSNKIHEGGDMGVDVYSEEADNQNEDVCMPDSSTIEATAEDATPSQSPNKLSLNESSSYEVLSPAKWPQQTSNKNSARPGEDDARCQKGRLADEIHEAVEYGDEMAGVTCFPQHPIRVPRSSPKRHVKRKSPIRKRTWSRTSRPKSLSPSPTRRQCFSRNRAPVRRSPPKQIRSPGKKCLQQKIVLVPRAEKKALSPATIRSHSKQRTPLPVTKKRTTSPLMNCRTKKRLPSPTSSPHKIKGRRRKPSPRNRNKNKLPCKNYPQQSPIKRRLDGMSRENISRGNVHDEGLLGSIGEPCAKKSRPAATKSSDSSVPIELSTIRKLNANGRSSMDSIVSLCQIADEPCIANVGPPPAENIATNENLEARNSMDSIISLWKAADRRSPERDVSRIVDNGVVAKLSEEEKQVRKTPVIPNEPDLKSIISGSLVSQRPSPLASPQEDEAVPSLVLATRRNRMTKMDWRNSSAQESADESGDDSGAAAPSDDDDQDRLLNQRMKL